MSYVYRDPRRAENQPPTTSAPKPPATQAEVQVHPKVKALLDRQKTRIQELEEDFVALGKKLALTETAKSKAEGEAKALAEKLEGLTENYDTLASVNVNLQEAAIRASKRAEEAEHEARLARAEADTPSAVKAIQELLDAEKQKTTKLTSKLAEVKGQLGRSRQRLADTRQEYEAALAGESEGLVATISVDGVELHKPYLEASHGQVVALLAQAQTLLGGARGSGAATSHR